MHFVMELPRARDSWRTGLHRDTIERALESETSPVYKREAKGSKLGPFEPEIHRVPGEDARLPGSGSVSCSSRWGCTASETVVD